jgi:hypothetical protein
MTEQNFREQPMSTTHQLEGSSLFVKKKGVMYEVSERAQDVPANRSPYHVYLYPMRHGLKME